MHVQIGRAAMEFIEHAEIGFAIPGAKLFLDVEDDQIVIDIPDEAMRLDLAGGQGARDLNEITDLNRMPGQQGAAPARGQSRSRSPSLGPARPRIVDRSLEGCNPIRQDDPMNRVVLIQLADFGFASKQRCPASRQVPLDPLRDTRLGWRMSNPKRWQASSYGIGSRISTAQKPSSLTQGMTGYHVPSPAISSPMPDWTRARARSKLLGLTPEGYSGILNAGLSPHSAPGRG